MLMCPLWLIGIGVACSLHPLQEKESTLLDTGQRSHSQQSPSGVPNPQSPHGKRGDNAVLTCRGVTVCSSDWNHSNNNNNDNCAAFIFFGYRCPGWESCSISLPPVCSTFGAIRSVHCFEIPNICDCLAGGGAGEDSILACSFLVLLNCFWSK